MEGARCIGGMQVATVPGHDFSGRTTLCPIGTAKICGISATGQDAIWSRELIRRHDDGFLRVIFQCAGASLVERDGWSGTIQADQWIILDGSQPHRILAREPSTQLALIVPRTGLSAAAYDNARRLSGPQGVFSGHSALLFRAMASILDDLNDQPGDADEDLGHTLLMLLTRSIEERQAAGRAASIRSARTDRARRHVLRNLSDPGLSVASIAMGLRCSMRQVHALFEGGPSVSEFIWSSRLEAAAAELCRPAARDRSMATIATSLGFHSAAHFSRRFKARFGQSPAHYRSIARHGQG